MSKKVGQIKTNQKIDRAETILEITDIILDMVNDGVDLVSTGEILHFMGYSDELIHDIVGDNEDIFNLKNLRFLRKHDETKQSFKIYEEIEQKLLINQKDDENKYKDILPDWLKS